jgi:hypothetical protein
MHPTESSLQAAEPRTFHGLHCTLTILRPTPGVVVAIFDGPDVGEFGDTPFRELATDVAGAAPIEVFIDARKVPAASIDVSAGWATWMSANRERIERLNILCGSRFIELTASFVQRFTQFGPRMRIYTDHRAFDQALDEASSSSTDV